MDKIINKVAESGLVIFDISKLIPQGERLGIDIKDFLCKGMILKEKEFREKIKNINTEFYENAYVYIYCSEDAIVPVWAYFLITAKITLAAKKIFFGNRKNLEAFLMHDAVQNYDFSDLKHKRVLVKGCSDRFIPINAYMELVEKLRPIVKSLMFGEACSNVPIFKNVTL